MTTRELERSIAVLALKLSRRLNPTYRPVRGDRIEVDILHPTGQVSRLTAAITIPLAPSDILSAGGGKLMQYRVQSRYCLGKVDRGRGRGKGRGNTAFYGPWLVRMAADTLPEAQRYVSRHQGTGLAQWRILYGKEKCPLC